MAQTRTDNTYWIFPLADNSEPYPKEIELIEKYVAKDEIVIPAEILKSYKAKPDEVLPEHTFETLRLNHQNTLNYIVIKEMIEPLGKGAFAGEKGIRARALLLYSGIYGSRVNFAKLTSAQQIYLAEIDELNLIDAHNIVNKTRYIQHLPLLEEDKEFYEKLKQPIAYANLQLADLKFFIRLKDELYIIPVAAFTTLRQINADEVIGYSYGANYWIGSNATPTLLRRNGLPIDRVSFEIFESEKQHLRFSLSPAQAKTFAEKRFIKSDSNVLFILPQYPKVLTVGGSNGSFLPVIYYVLNTGKDGFMGVVKGEDVIYFRMITPAPEQAKKLKELCEGIKLGIMLVPVGDKTKMVIPVKDLVRLSLKNIRRAFEMLNALVLDRDKFKMVIVENKMMRKDTVPVGVQGLFGKKGAMVEEKKGELKIPHCHPAA